MLKLLHIENIAVIETADIEFSPGFNVLTGETGAGKSIVIDSLSAVTGSRTSRNLLRTGADSASVTAVFECEDSAALPDWAEPDENGEIYISRKITTDGKSVCRVNNTPVQATALRDLGAALLDIHGQNDGRKLLDEGAHLEYLDIFGSLEPQLNEYREAYCNLVAKKKEIDKLSMDESEKARRIDILRFQINEIEQADLRPGEQSELMTRRELLQNASKLTESVETAFEALYGAGESQGAVAIITGAHNALDNAARYSEELQTLSDRLNDVRYSAQDISEELRDFRVRLDFSPGELETLEERLDVLKKIARKYGSEEKALEQLEDNKTELQSFEDSDNRLVKLEAELEACLNDAKRLAGILSNARRSTAKTLSDKVKDELSQLNMPGVKFTVEFSDIDGEYGLCATGQDDVCYLMSANPGEAPGRINRIASGGELARIMLALKNVLSSATDSAAMVFDEIDTGVSGIAAQRVGEKLATLAKDRQVLCVTHLPQIAVMADTHFSITKSVKDGRTYTHVEPLSSDGRQREIARLTGGENITDTTLKSAGEQLSAAEKYKSSSLRAAAQ